MASEPTRRGATPMLAATLFRKILNEFRNILPALGKRGNANRHHREPMEEVFAKTSLGDRLRQIPARRRNDAHVHRDTGGAADPLEILIDQNRRILACVSRGMSAISSR